MKRKLLAIGIGLALVVVAYLQPFVRVSVDDFGVAVRYRDSVHEKYHAVMIWQWKE